MVATVRFQNDVIRVHNVCLTRGPTKSFLCLLCCFLPYFIYLFLTFLLSSTDRIICSFYCVHLTLGLVVLNVRWRNKIYSGALIDVRKSRWASERYIHFVFFNVCDSNAIFFSFVTSLYLDLFSLSVTDIK